MGEAINTYIENLYPYVIVKWLTTAGLLQGSWCWAMNSAILTVILDTNKTKNSIQVLLQKQHITTRK